MAEASLIFEWGVPVYGREKLATAFVVRGYQLATDAKNRGEIEAFHIYLFQLGPTSQRSSQVIMEGTTEQIDQLVNSEQFLHLRLHGEHVMQSFAIHRAITGAPVMRHLMAAETILAELGLSSSSA